MKEIEIFVATHKIASKYGDGCYHMIHVGAETSTIEIPETIKDNGASDNISSKNNIYCELTGLYYIWKNVKDVKYVGLCHYRRLPALKKIFQNDPEILSEKELVTILNSYDLILPRKTKKNGVINGYFTEGDSAINEYRPYKLMLPVVQELYPEYVDDFKKEFHTRTMSFGNIMICDKSLFDEYCKWLFDILFKLEENINMSGDRVLPRELGFYSEWLLNIWMKHKRLKVKYVPLFLPERKTLMERIKDKIQKK